MTWFAGIDTAAWPDLSAEPKDLDFIVYDKVHWDRQHYQASLIEPISGALEARGLTHEMIRYGEYDHTTFRALLKRARGLIWLSENETQGLAYQEAMSCGLPVLAWDRGYWADPQWRDHFVTPPPASSVPFFSDACGERFVGMDDFGARLEDFLSRRERLPAQGICRRKPQLRPLGRALRDRLFRRCRRAPVGLGAGKLGGGRAVAAGRRRGKLSRLPLAYDSGYRVREHGPCSRKAGCALVRSKAARAGTRRRKKDYGGRELS